MATNSGCVKKFGDFEIRRRPTCQRGHNRHVGRMNSIDKSAPKPELECVPSVFADGVAGLTPLIPVSGTTEDPVGGCVRPRVVLLAARAAPNVQTKHA